MWLIKYQMVIIKECLIIYKRWAIGNCGSLYSHTYECELTTREAKVAVVKAVAEFRWEGLAQCEMAGRSRSVSSMCKSFTVGAVNTNCEQKPTSKYGGRVCIRT